jgi:2-methyleneglutarate mutase
MFEKKIKDEGAGFLGVDEFFGPGTDLDEFVKWVDESLANKKNK